jgi:ribosomal protein L32
MGATPKRRRSSSKRRSTMGSNRYDKVLTKMKKIKKFGGSFLVRSKTTGKLSPAHRVSKENPEYKGKQIINA